VELTAAAVSSLAASMFGSLETSSIVLKALVTALKSLLCRRATLGLVLVLLEIIRLRWKRKAPRTTDGLHDSPAPVLDRNYCEQNALSFKAPALLRRRSSHCRNTRRPSLSTIAERAADSS